MVNATSRINHCVNRKNSNSKESSTIYSSSVTEKVQKLAAYGLKLSIFIPIACLCNTLYKTGNLVYTLGAPFGRQIKKITELFYKIFFYLTPTESLSSGYKSINHSDLIKIGKAFGYKDLNKGGVCNGVALMGIQAALIKDMGAFSDRIDKLSQLMHKYRRNVAAVVRAVERDPIFFNECLAFFDGITLLQSLNHDTGYELFQKTRIQQNTKKHLNTTLPITASQKLKEKGGMCRVVSFSGVYRDKKEFCSYLKQLKGIFYKSLKEPPVAIRFDNGNHAMSIVYDLKTKNWVLIDANGALSPKRGNDEWLANKVVRVSSTFHRCNPFQGLSGHVLTSDIYALNKHAVSLNKRVELWSTTKEYKDLHEASSRKSLLMVEKSSWLWMAAKDGHTDSVKALLAQGVKPTITDKDDNHTPLYVAVQNDQRDIVKMLLAKGANPNTKNNKGYTPLNMAIQNGYFDIVKMLLAKGANPNTKNNKGHTPLDMAIQNGYFNIVKMLLAKGSNPNMRDDDNWTPLHRVSCQGDLEAIKILLGNGANPNINNKNGQSPFFLASLAGRADVMKLLLSAGASSGIGSLLVTSILGDVSTVFDLINGAYHQKAMGDSDPIDSKNKNGETLIWKAARDGRLNDVKALLSKGADVNIADYDGINPLQIAVDNGHLNVVKVLIKQGADLKIKDHEGYNLLHSAVANGNLDIIKILLDKGLNPNDVNYDGDSSLIMAIIQENNVKVIQMLLDRGADPNLHDNTGATPLALAVLLNRIDIVKVLLDKGANLNSADYLGKTPLDIALEKGYSEIAQLIRSKKPKSRRKR